MAPPKLSEEERIRRRKESQRKYDLINQERKRTWRLQNAERLKEYAKNHYQENKEKYLKKAFVWQTENTERKRQIKSEFKKRNRGAATADTAKYRADKDKRTPNWLTEFDHIHIKALYQLAAMRTRESGFPWHVDHIIPLRGRNVSGLHIPSNMRVIPGEENVRKNNVFVVE